MTEHWYRAAWMQGNVDIETSVDFDEAAKLIAEALSVQFAKDIECKYEEFPAWVGECAGYEFAFLGIPLPEEGSQESKIETYQLQISSVVSVHPAADPQVINTHNVEVSAFFAHLLADRTGLICRANERPGTA